MLLTYISRVTFIKLYFSDFKLYMKGKYVSRYKPGSYISTEGNLNHYFELLSPTFLNDLNDEVLDKLLEEVCN